MIETFMKNFFPDLMLFRQRDKENLNDVWHIFKCLVKACPHNGILECVLMEGFYFRLSEDTQ